MSDKEKVKDSYVWFDGETVEKLTDQLNDAGPGARLEIRGEGTHTTLTVVSPDEAARVMAQEVLNKAHACPPDCG